jgi:transmembrane sensor
MDRYATYTIQDFVQDEAFIKWVKYPTHDRIAFWKSVTSKYPHQEHAINQAAILIQKLVEFHPEVPDSEIEKAGQAILDRYNSKKPFYSHKLFYLISSAASVMLMIGVGWWYFKSDNSSNNLQPQVYRSVSTKITNNDKIAVKTITLPDSSSIRLSAQSNVQYHMIGEGDRKVYLEGDAFFSVARDEKRPFYVFCNGLVTKVIGTSFKISSAANGEVKVEVSSGKVQVYREDNLDEKEKTMILTPNQSVVYRKNDLLLTRSVVARPKVLVSAERLKLYTYVDTPLSQIFEGLEEVYGIKMIYDEEKFKDCKLNMVLSDESLFEKLELIGKVVEGHYNIIDGQVIFIGDGCSE